MHTNYSHFFLIVCTSIIFSNLFWFLFGICANLIAVLPNVIKQNVSIHIKILVLVFNQNYNYGKSLNYTLKKLFWNRYRKIKHFVQYNIFNLHSMFKLFTYLIKLKYSLFLFLAQHITCENRLNHIMWSKFLFHFPKTLLAHIRQWSVSENKFLNGLNELILNRANELLTFVNGSLLDKSTLESFIQETTSRISLAND